MGPYACCEMILLPGTDWMRKRQIFGVYLRVRRISCLSAVLYAAGKPIRLSTGHENIPCLTFGPDTGMRMA